MEGLVGLGAIAGLAAIVANISTNTNNRGTVYRRACESMASNAIDAITDEAVFMDVKHFTPSAGKQNITALEGPALFEIVEIQNADLWNGATDIVDHPNDGTDLPPVIRTETLIQGSMRALNALYNNAAATDFCAGFETYPSMTVGGLGIENELTRADPLNPPIIELNLTPIQRLTNTPNCRPKPFFIAPRAGLPANQRAYNLESYDSLENGLGITALGVDGMVENSVEYNVQYRWRLSAKVNYSYNGEAFECIVSRDFDYPVDNLAPDLSAGAVVVSAIENTSRETSYPTYACPHPISDREVTLRIQVPDLGANSLETGSLLFCRDISEEMVYNDPGAINEDPVSPMCYQGTGAAADTRGRVDPRESLTNPSFRDHIAAVPSEDKWYPCHAARICGGVGGANENFGAAGTPAISPASVTILEAPGELRQSYPITLELNYTNVPTDCLIGLQVVAIDIAGNVSAAIADSTVITPTAGSHAFLSDANSPFASPMYTGNAGETITGGFDVATFKDFRAVHRPWCGDPGGTALNLIGTPGSGTYGTVTPFGILCQAAPIATDVPNGDPLTPNWEDDPDPIIVSLTGASSNTALNVPVGLNVTTADGNWNDEYPNGYYTCRAGGCCFGTSLCTPWSN